MIYNSVGQNDVGSIFVVLKSEALVRDAIKELTGAPLFNKRIRVEVPRWYRSADARRQIQIRWGWYANESSLMKDVKLRYPRTSPPRNCFESFREGKHIVFNGLPADNDLSSTIMQWTYKLLHTYNVLGLTEIMFYRSRHTQGQQYTFIGCQLATKREAEVFCQLNQKPDFYGSSVAVFQRRPPMSVLGASWDPGKSIHLM